MFEDWYILDEDHHVVSIGGDIEKLRGWYGDSEAERRRVGLAEFADGRRVSTVFLGLDHGIGGERPIVFETMVFAPNSMEDLACWRYATWEQAVAGHDLVVGWLKDGATPEEVPLDHVSP